MTDLMLEACLDSWFKAHDDGAIFSDEFLMTFDKSYREQRIFDRWSSLPENINKTMRQLKEEYQIFRKTLKG